METEGKGVLAGTNVARRSLNLGTQDCARKESSTLVTLPPDYLWFPVTAYGLGNPCAFAGQLRKRNEGSDRWSPGSLHTSLVHVQETEHCSYALGKAGVRAPARRHTCESHQVWDYGGLIRL